VNLIKCLWRTAIPSSPALSAFLEQHHRSSED
jgi:hypothetical protein